MINHKLYNREQIRRALHMLISYLFEGTTQKGEYYKPWQPCVLKDTVHGKINAIIDEIEPKLMTDRSTDIGYWALSDEDREKTKTVIEHFWYRQNTGEPISELLDDLINVYGCEIIKGKHR